MTFLSNFYHKRKHLILYGAALAVLVFFMKWLQWKFLITDNAMDIYIGMIALLFTGLGIWVAMQLTTPKVKTIVVEKEVTGMQSDASTIDIAVLENLQLTNREYEVLLLLCTGHSNTEIANQLFLSLSTIKTHVSNLYTKLDVKSRVQAIDKAKRLKIVE
jgi:DNA-binding CsgD family transcriptional regulator